MKVLVTDIDWDCDEQDVDLPDSVEIEVSNDAGHDDVIDAVSDEYGWCINGVGQIRYIGG